MTPLEFLRRYEFDQRILRGGYYPSSALSVDEGDRVGVVLFSRGGPKTLDEVRSFLYNLYMDPALVDLPVGGFLRHWLSRGIASYRTAAVTEKYELIGGGSPLVRLAQEQAQSVQRYLNGSFGEATGVDFRTYVASRYGHPFSEDAVAQMKNDGVEKVVLLPLAPQYSKSTTGSSLAYWHALETAGALPTWPTTLAVEYAANPRYVQALSERIDEALQRFPRETREEVHLLFSAYGAPRLGRTERQDPYCCLVHSTVEQILRRREWDHPSHTAFQGGIGSDGGSTPSTAEVLNTLASHGVSSVLVVPVSFVSDRVETSYGLDVELREEAERAGIVHYEVAAGLNTHPLFIEALAEATVAQLELPISANELRARGNGHPREYRLRPFDERPLHHGNGGGVRCPHCNRVAEARQWTQPEEVEESGPERGERARNGTSLPEETVGSQWESSS